MSDIYLKPTESGEDITVSAGMPQMSGGLDNAVYMSLFTADFWGNDTAVPDEIYNSDIPNIIGSGLLTNQVRLNIIEEAKRVLQWLITDGIADSISVDAEIPKLGNLYLSVQVNEPQRTANFKYGLNWDEQKVNIINNEPERIKDVVKFTYISDTGDTFISDTGEIYISDSYLN